MPVVALQPNFLRRMHPSRGDRLRDSSLRRGDSQNESDVGSAFESLALGGVAIMYLAELMVTG